LKNKIRKKKTKKIITPSVSQSFVKICFESCDCVDITDDESFITETFELDIPIES
jgi:hypothetical protein